LRADPEYQRRSARFLENHDEPRAAAAFPPPVSQAAAVIASLVPGLRFFHEGQCSGRKLRASNHLGRRAAEPADLELRAFYERLLGSLRRGDVREGDWRLLEPRAAWEGNGSWERFVAFAWEGSGSRTLVAVNYGDTRAQCFVPLPFDNLEGRGWRLRDLLHSDTVYDRDGGDIARRGLYLDEQAWGAYHFGVVLIAAWSPW